VIDKISSAQPRSTAVKSIFESYGSIGNSAINLPNLVNNPSSSNAPRVYNYSIAAINVCTGGGSIKSKFIKSFIPIAFRIRTVVDKFVRYISGTEVGSISLLNASSVYSL
jgi:hypothetical protein